MAARQSSKVVGRRSPDRASNTEVAPPSASSVKSPAPTEKLQSGRRPWTVKLVRRLRQQALDQLRREADPARGLVDLGAGVREDPAPVGRVAAHADGAQHLERALVDLRLLVLREDLDVRLHQAASSAASASAMAIAASPASHDGVLGPP